MFDSASSAEGADVILTEISFSEMLLVWKNQLWLKRQSVIEPYSAININGEIDDKIVQMQPEAHFFATYQQNQIVAVTSFHKTSDKEYRLRGTWVHHKHRGQGLGKKLISTLIQRNFEKGDKIWTLSRDSSKLFYEKIGFSFFKSVNGYEYGPHSIMVLKK